MQLVFAVSGSGLGFRDSGLRRSQSRDPGIFSGLAIRQDFTVTEVGIGPILVHTLISTDHYLSEP